MKGPISAGLLLSVLVLLNGLYRALPQLADSPYPAGPDAPAYCRIARQLVHSGSLELPSPGAIDQDPQMRLESAFGTPYALTRDGRLLPKHSWLFAALLAPGYAIAGVPGAVVAYLLIASALTGLVTWRAAAQHGVLPALLAGTVAFLWAPASKTVTLEINLDLALAAAMFGSAVLAAKGRPLGAGLVAGVGLLLRPTMVVLLVAPVWVALRKGGRPALFKVGIGLLPGLAVVAALNMLWWGAPWISSYQRAAVLTPDGMRVADILSRFGGGVLEGLQLFFLDRRGGLIWTAALPLLGCLGYLKRSAREPEWVGCTVAGLLVILLLSPYDFLRELPGYNFRFAYPLLISTVGPIAALVGWASRRQGKAPT